MRRGHALKTGAYLVSFGQATTLSPARPTKEPLKRLSGRIRPPTNSPELATAIRDTETTCPPKRPLRNARQSEYLAP